MYPFKGFLKRTSVCVGEPKSVKMPVHFTFYARKVIVPVKV